MILLLFIIYIIAALPASRLHYVAKKFRHKGNVTLDLVVSLMNGDKHLAALWAPGGCTQYVRIDYMSSKKRSILTEPDLRGSDLRERSMMTSSNWSLVSVSAAALTSFPGNDLDENINYTQWPNNHQICYMRQSRDMLEVQEPSGTFRQVRYRQLHRRPSTAQSVEIGSGLFRRESLCSLIWSQQFVGRCMFGQKGDSVLLHGIIQVSCTGVRQSRTNLPCVECDLLLLMSSDALQILHHHHHQLLTLKLTKNI